MSRVAFLFVLFTASSAPAAEPPPGALVRIGDDRYRAGVGVWHFALSPDGKRFATVRSAERNALALTVWDAATGRPVHEQRVNGTLFRGLVWGKGGAFAIVRRAEPIANGKLAKAIADDFRVWDFTDPDAAPPVGPPVGDSKIHDVVPQYDAEYADFQFSADGSRVAALWAGADGKYAVHVFALKPVDTAAKLTRVGAIDLGAEGAGAVRLSADGKALVTFRALAEAGGRGVEFVATVWDVAAGKPAKPVRVSSTAGTPPRPSRGERERITHRLMLTPDGRAVVLHAAEEKAWGFDRTDIGIPHQRRELIRLPYGPADRPSDRAGVRDGGAHAFFPSGDGLAVATDRQTLVFDSFTGKELGRLEGHADTPTEVAVSADGGTIATADIYGLVRLWDAKTFRPLRDAPGHRAPVEHAELSPDGKRLLTWAPDETVRLWDLATGAELRAFTGAAGAPNVLDRPSFTPDGTAILFRAKDRLVSRDLLTGLEVPLPDDTKPRPPRAESLTARSPDGRTSAREAGPYRGEVQLLEAATGEVRRTLDGHRGDVRVLGFTPDGSRLLTAGDDHTVLVWDMRLQNVPLPDAIKKETNAAKLWDVLAGGNAKDAYLAMARLVCEPDAAIKLAKMKLKPATKGDKESDATNLTTARAIELLEALDTGDARTLLKEVAGGHADAFRTREAKRAMDRNRAVTR